MYEFRRNVARGVDRLIEYGIERAIADPGLVNSAINVGKKFVRNSASRLALYGVKKAVEYKRRQDAKKSISENDMYLPITPKSLKGSVKRKLSFTKAPTGFTKKRVVSTGTLRGTGSYSGKFKKMKKANKKIVANKALYGCLIQNESNASITSPTVAYITQATPILMLKKAMVFSLIKHIFNRMNILFTAYTDVIPKEAFGDGASVQTVNFQVKYYLTTSGTLSSFIETFSTDLTTYEQLGNGIVAALDALFVNNPAGIQFESVCVYWSFGGIKFPARWFDINHCKFQGFARNSMTFQNTTLTSDTVGTTATDSVTANPLEVTMYGGSGTGPLSEISKRGNFTSFISNGTLGYVSYAPSSSVAVGNEPFPSAVIGNCSRVGKSVIQPGAIKKSPMMKKYSGNFWKLYTRLVGTATGDIQYLKVGTYKLFAFDKIVTKAIDNVCAVSFEVNQEAGGTVTNLFRPKMNPLVTSS